MKLRRIRFALFTSIVFIATSLLFCMAVGEAVAPKVSPAAAERQQLIYGKPVRIAIDSLHINLPVVDGTYDPIDKSWTLNQDTVQYATVTPLANNIAGNTFIYGHATSVLFGRMVGVQPGAVASVTTNNGDVFYYRFINSVDVSPDEVGAIKYSGPAQLTVQTCVGSYYQNRRIFHFAFVKAVTPVHPSNS